MPKISKVQAASTKPKQAAPVENARTMFHCSRCTRYYKKQKGNFPASQSSLYKGNGGYLVTCNYCMDELFEHYKIALESETEAIRRICLKFDIYWNPEIYDMLNKASTSNSRVRAYISKSNLYKYVGKTYDDTLDEEMQSQIEAEQNAIISTIEPVYNKENDEIIIDEDIIKYWGTGFTPDMYTKLEERRAYWLSQYPEGTVLNPGEEGILRQICNLEISINQDMVAGRSIEKSVNSLNALFGSMNIKPSQKKEADDNHIPFGCEIARFEEESPIIEPDEDFRDVDGLHRNVITWFLGSLCKTAGIKNEYSQYFEEEIGKYTVERPMYDTDDELEDVEGGDTDG